MKKLNKVKKRIKLAEISYDINKNMWTITRGNSASAFTTKKDTVDFIKNSVLHGDVKKK